MQELRVERKREMAVGMILSNLVTSTAPFLILYHLECLSLILCSVWQIVVYIRKVMFDGFIPRCEVRQ